MTARRIGSNEKREQGGGNRGKNRGTVQVFTLFQEAGVKVVEGPRPTSCTNHGQALAIGVCDPAGEESAHVPSDLPDPQEKIGFPGDGRFRCAGE